tara:strand:+ start:7238 stop:8389 length:1152 start_codon:yes stop_codon:yes gene_type:complete
MEILAQYKPTEYKRENKSIGVMINGEANLRSLISENLIQKSPTASYCVGMYSKFITGAGFVGGEENISNKPYSVFTINKLLNECAKDHAKLEGSFIHVRYNALFEKIGFERIPYTQCRFGLEDDDNYSGKIVRAKKGWGKRAKKESFVAYDVYNPNPDTIQRQVDLAGGWENYRGQIMFIGDKEDMSYPKSKIEGIENFAHTEHKMGVYYASTVERGFENIQIFEYVKSDNPSENEALKESVTNAMGLENSGKILGLPYANSTDLTEGTKYKFTPLENNASPATYDHFLDRCSTMIRAKFEIPVQLFEAVSGKLGNSSGEDLKVAQSMYNQTTAPIRAMYEVAFSELFRGYKRDLNIDFTIQQYSILADGTTEEENEPLKPTE